MVLELTDNIYDNCDSPICEDPIEVYLISYPSIADDCENVYIAWKVTGLESESSLFPNKILWSFGDQGFSNSSSSETIIQNYYTNFTCSQGPGLLYIKARVGVNGKFYESNVHIIIVGEGDCSESEE